MSAVDDVVQPMVVLRAEGLGHRYGRKEVLKSVDILVRKGEIVCVVGPSGTGKTTLLRCLSGLLRPMAGSVSVADHVVSSPPKEMALVFQDYSRSLLPWLSVADNVALALANESLGRVRKKELATEALGTVGLHEVGAMYPWQLSGGMQQRVAVARALVARPQVVLMDEPFASVDAQTRADLEDMVVEVRARLGVTVLLVTHDIDEAVYLGDRVVVLSGKPASVEAVIKVGFGKERDQIETKSLPEFAQLRTEVTKLIRADTRSAAARCAGR